MTKLKTESLLSKRSHLSEAENQISILNQSTRESDRKSFHSTLAENGQLPLKPKTPEILQINVGYMCNQTCEHCHVDAGPDRKEIMTRETMEHCLDFIDKTSIHTVDLTGGAPEMNPHFIWFVEELSKRNKHVIVRSNLTILVANKKYKTYPEFFKKHGVEVIASLPCYTKENTDKQRGDGVFSASVEALKRLNELGYGKEDSKLKLNLVYNPGGPSLPPPQAQLEHDYKVRLKEDFDITFNHLYTITNLPISRFLDYLLVLDKLDYYMELLVNSFNPATTSELMCRNTLSVDWKGGIYDCDFNQMLQLNIKQGKENVHISSIDMDWLMQRTICTGEHCFGCTAGAGSSCQGTLS